MTGFNHKLLLTGRMLGRAKPSNNPHVPKLERLMGTYKGQLNLPAVPNVLDRSNIIPFAMGMMLNGYDSSQPAAPQLGDCSIAGLYHGRQISNAMAGKAPLNITNDNILEAYENFCDYKLGDASTDNGGILDKVLAGDNQTGIRIGNVFDPNLSFFQFDVHNEDHLKHVINTYGYAYVGGEMPSMVCDAPGKPIFDAPKHARIEGGHCYLIWGWDENGNYRVISWGMKDLVLTPRFLANYVDEGYGIMTAELLDSNGRSPAGFDETELAAIASGYREV